MRSLLFLICSQVVSEYFPSEQATDFIAATLGGLLSASPTCATAAGLWMKIILKECGDAMLDKVKLGTGELFCLNSRLFDLCPHV